MVAEARHAAVVLAAGGSRRLGRPKQRLQRDGETLLRRALRVAAETSPRRLLLVLGAEREALAAGIGDIDCEIVDSPDWEEGLASSLRAVHARLRDSTGRVLLLGCDQPALEVSHLDALIAGAVGASSGCAATGYGARLGLPAVVTRALLAHSGELHGDHGLRAPLNALAAGSVWRLDAPELGIDLDTSADVERAIELGLLDRPPPSHWRRHRP
jgi:molybdenum cofactor cytidylyltransferase